MVSAQDAFKAAVIDPFQVNRSGKILSYTQYIHLPTSQQAGDEADVVDSRFTSKILQDWLGFAAGDIVYNHTLPGQPKDKPDFVLTINGKTAFIVEDKSPDKKLDESSIAQMRRYTASTSGYCLWINGRVIVGLRFDANGRYQMLVEVQAENVFGEQQPSLPQEANFEILHQLFSKQRFTDTATYIQAITHDKDEDDWRKHARTLTDTKSLQTFINESRTVLDQLVTAIQARLNTVAIELKEAEKDLDSNQQKYHNLQSNLIDKLKGGGGVKLSEIQCLEKALNEQENRLADLNISTITHLKPQMGTATIPIWTDFVQKVQGIVSHLREYALACTEARRIQNAYRIWLERYKHLESESQNNNSVEDLRQQKAFAEQVSYVFFVRLLLARVLEDKGIMPRMVSDGGFKHWFDFLKTSYLDSLSEIRGETFLPLVYRRVAGFYQHFFQQPIFDWFLPDDSLLALVLSHLNQYDFKDVGNDLLGFTYEAFIERIARNRKGHFLTPPEVVEFMLDQAGYTSKAIIGENVIDLSCGSGSFLVHAARRLKSTISSALADASPLERANQYIEQVKTKLVGLEIDPFSCYLAELNLFIQVLDDLALLWNNGERPNIERFAIYNTNSLEMPLAVLQSEYKTTATTTFDEDAITLDEAASIKAQPKVFTYILCNPPYVNRGIIDGIKSYGEYPFYREVVKGDENFYLLFLRLAAYYSAPGGTICFICPLNLLGDESTTRTREMFNRTDDWSLRSITRFYTRTVLFPGVLQGVCVIRIDQISQPIDKVELRGGFSIAEVRQQRTLIAHSRITTNYPAKTTWNKPWLVNANPEVYSLWECIQHNCPQELGELITGKLSTAKGDVRSTWAKPLLVTTAGSKAVPLTKGEKIIDWGAWSPAAYLDPSLTIPSTVANYKSCLWVQKNIRRIVNLEQPETVLLLKEVSGLEMKRPIRGTITQRSSSQPLVADETVLIMHTMDNIYANLAYAVFGLITSALYNFLFSLFSTNAHANLKEIQRLPVPVWSATLETHLAETTRHVLRTYQNLHEHERAYGKGQNGNIDINITLTTSRLPTVRLEELLLRGEVMLNGSPTHALAVLHKRGQIRFDPQLSHEARVAIEQIIQANGHLAYGKGGKDLLVPNPKVAKAFLAQLEQHMNERQQKRDHISRIQDILDTEITEAYGVHTPAWQDLISSGIPWAKD